MTILVASAATLVIISASQPAHSKAKQRSKLSLFSVGSDAISALSQSKNDKTTQPMKDSAGAKYMKPPKLKYLMPLLSSKSALLTNNHNNYKQLKLSNIKPLASQLYKQSSKIFNDKYQPIIPQNLQVNHREKINHLIDRLNSIVISLAKESVSRIREDFDDNAKHRKEEEKLIISPKRIGSTKLATRTTTTNTTTHNNNNNNKSEIKKTKNKAAEEEQEDNKVTTDKDEEKKKRHKANKSEEDDEFRKNDSTKVDTKNRKVDSEGEKAKEEEDEIVNEPPNNRVISRFGSINSISGGKKDGDNKKAGSNNNSSYSLTLDNGRSSLQPITSSGKLTSNGAKIKNSNDGPRASTKSAAIALAPSLESIAMRIVSSAASKSIGRSSAHLSSSNSGHHSGSSAGGETFPQSLFSSLSSSILSTAMSQLINSSSFNPAPSTATTSTTTSGWPNKLSPLLYSLASLSGFNSDDSSNPPSSSSSFLSTDLSTSSSSAQPTLYSGAGTHTGKPHTSKQYSPTVSGMVNLARYVLCEYYYLRFSASLLWKSSH